MPDFARDKFGTFALAKRVDGQLQLYRLEGPGHLGCFFTLSNGFDIVIILGCFGHFIMFEIFEIFSKFEYLRFGSFFGGPRGYSISRCNC